MTQETLIRFYDKLDELKKAFDRYDYLTDTDGNGINEDAETLIAGMIGKIDTCINALVA